MTPGRCVVDSHNEPRRHPIRTEAPPMSDSRPSRSGPGWLLLAAVFTGFGFLFVWRFFGGFSLDLHAARVAVVVLLLLGGSLIAFRPGRMWWAARFAVLAAASVF